MNDYVIAWSLYLIAVASAQMLLWRIFSFISNTELKVLLQLLLLATLITPASLDDDKGGWVPAFMAALMEGINLGTDAAVIRLTPILILMLIFTVLAIISSVYRYYCASKIKL